MVETFVHVLNHLIYDVAQVHIQYNNWILISLGGCFIGIAIILLMRTWKPELTMMPKQYFQAYLETIITNAEAIKSKLSSDFTAGSATGGSGANDAVVASLTQQVATLTQQLTTAKTSGGPDPAVAAENVQLKKQIEELKKAQPKGGANDGRIAELEAKLQEYEVIVEDLANLKEYKEENARLKAQLAGGATPTPAPAPAPKALEPAPVAATPAPAPEPVTEPPVTKAETEEKIDELVGKVEQTIAEPEDVAEVEEPEEDLSDQDKALLEEFEKMIGDDKGAAASGG